MSNRLLKPVDLALGSRTSLAVLRTLFRQAPGAGVTGRHAARLAGIPQKSAALALAALSKARIVACRPAGAANLYSIDRSNPLARELGRIFSAEGRAPELAAASFRKALSGMKGLVGAAIFGSFARGDYDSDSDIDILVVVRDETAKEDAYRRAASAAGLPLPASPLVLTQEEFKNTGKPLLADITRDGLPVIGRAILTHAAGESEDKAGKSRRG